jgi:hypothetical protein
MRAIGDMRALKTRRKKAIAESPPSLDMSLLALVPERAAADAAVQLYLDTLEHAYHILHLPSFLKQYETLWDNPDQCRPGFVPTLLLMLSAVSCAGLRAPLSYVADSSSPREKAIRWIQACDTWLQRQSKKHRTLEILQVYCLLQIAKQVNSVNLKQSWIAAGYMLRVAIAAGLHRDPSLLGDHVSCFDQEIRRRLWAAMVELELQASIDRGMPSALAAIHMDCKAPFNINDEDLMESGKTLPQPKPCQEYTLTSFLNLSYRSLRLRTSFNTLVNASSMHLSYEDVLRYDEEISEQLATIPKWKSTNVSSESHTFSRLLLDIQLRQFLILLHSPFVGPAESNSRASFSRAACINAAITILEHHYQLRSAGTHLLYLLRNDVYRASMAIFHSVSLSKSIQGRFPVRILEKFSKLLQKISLFRT